MVETYESGHMSMGSLTTFLSKVFGSDNIVGETPGGDCWIHLKVAPSEAEEKLSQTLIFEAESFEDIPNVNAVETNEEDGYVRLDVINA